MHKNSEVRTTVAYLKWLTDENRDRRSRVVDESFHSLYKLASQVCDVFIINNGGIKTDNEFPTINLSKNYYDVAVHFSAYWLAKRKNREFFIYTYDDFVFFDDNFLESCEKFLDLNTEVSCLRLPHYEYGNSYFNANVTPKSINPDAVRHELGAAGADLYFDGPFFTSECSFYKTNWYLNSRPMMWRVKSFEKFLDYLNLEVVPVMQPFERFLYNTADLLAVDKQFVSSFIDKGVCKTFSTKNSERELAQNGNLRVNWGKIFVNAVELKKELLSATEYDNGILYRI